MLLKDLRESVIEYALKVIDAGLISSTWGNISARDPESGLIAITPSGMEYRKLSPDDIVIVNKNGNIVDSKRKPSSETPMHALFYRERPEINGIVHTHSCYATAMSTLKKEIPVVLAELGACVGGPVKVAEYARGGTEEFGQAALRAIGDGTAVLQQNHGVLAIGKTLNDALFSAIVVEEAAKIYWLALQVGEPFILPDQEVKEIHEGFIKTYGQK
ncbi:class II aldolase/adducin family protein [Pelotomaculum propionicicum]|uniref:L-fuculose phosphate aldolase n=1 Tax=Pelotomaculum propionicicum TaxID=258475 RepID=A0A4Y7RSN5_9FIRM|nr:class II aldolase/adducin family protein [Pelotomaculum propionicicum]NLI11294.1 class II aldolase/adducin family protein [Peptococcaceae bacterium]TEB11277.1 L-fuculose phosphate aldolase [Pelotomaculum propionicicum]